MRNLRSLSAAFVIPPMIALSVAGADFTVSNVGFSAYRINGSDNPTLTLERGKTYTFAISASGHPFWIKTSPVIGTTAAFSSGVTGNGTQSGSLTFTVPAGAPDTLFYICQFHTPMVGTLLITNAAAPSPAVLGGAVVLSGGLFQFTVQGTAGRLHTIEVNTNAAGANWTTLTTTNPPASTFTVVDTTSGSVGQRFYRVSQ